MIIDLREVKDAPLKDHDLVIVDTGPADVTLTHELIGSGLKLPSKERILDGSSMTWPKLSNPLDEIDLARHLSSTLKASS